MLFTRKQHQWYQHVLLMLFCFFLPIHQRLATGIILLLGLNWLLGSNFREKFQAFLHPLALIFSAFYCVHLFGLFYTSDLPSAHQNIETKLSLLVFPLLLFSFPIPNSKEIKQQLYCFILACFVAATISLIKAGIVYTETGKNVFYYENLSNQLGFHPSYYACYFALALFLVSFFLVDAWHKLTLAQRSLSILLSAYFMIFILMLSARMEILAVFLLFPVAFIVFMFRRKQLLQGVGIMLAGLLCVGTIAYTLPGTKMRIQAALNGLFSSNKTEAKPDIRLQIWGSAIEVIKEKPIIGHGTSGAFPKMLEQYRQNNYSIAEAKELNIHNQYLETTAALGILGLILLLAQFIIPFALAWQKEQFIYLFFIALFALAILTESMLERQQGVIFFAYFNSLFACWMLQKE